MFEPEQWHGKRSNKKCLEILLSYEINIDCQNALFQKALHRKNIIYMQVLIKHGVDAKQCIGKLYDKDEYPLHTVCSCEHTYQIGDFLESCRLVLKPRREDSFKRFKEYASSRRNTPIFYATYHSKWHFFRQGHLCLHASALFTSWIGKMEIQRLEKADITIRKFLPWLPILLSCGKVGMYLLL